MPDLSYSTSTEPSESPDAGEPAEDQKENETSALLPKSILAGKEFKVGDEVVLKIDAMYDDEIEVSYATGKEDKPKDEGESEMSKSMSAMDNYASEPSEA
jgi:hypothetical protein